MDRRPIAALAVLVAATLLVVLGIALTAEHDATDADPRPSPAPRPGATSVAAAPRAVRASLPPPAGIDRPEPPPEPPPPAEITGEDRRLMNVSVDAVLRAARAECLEPWLDGLGDGDEFVFDTVLYDGRVFDVGIRAMAHDIPGDVLACVADRAWYADWPEWDLPGELRLQRSIDIPPPRPSAP